MPAKIGRAERAARHKATARVDLALLLLSHALLALALQLEQLGDHGFLVEEEEDEDELGWCVDRQKVVSLKWRKARRVRRWGEGGYGPGTNPVDRVRRFPEGGWERVRALCHK